MALKNGQVPRIFLRSIAGVLLAPLPAADLKQLIQNATKAGVHLVTVSSPNGAAGYRSLAIQRDMAARRSYYNENPKVVLAQVGHSTHGLGHAVDIASGPALEYMIKYGPAHRWHRTNPVGDPNHFEHAS